MNVLNGFKKKTANLNLRSAFLRALNCFDARLLNTKIIRKSPSINMCNGVYETQHRKKPCIFAMKTKYYNLDYISKTKRYAVTNSNLKIIRQNTK